MTEREFIEALQELEISDWTLLGGDMIRCNGGCDCPATALAKARGLLPETATADDVGSAMSLLELKNSSRFRIIAAADNSSTEPLRKRMLAACGL